MKKFFFSLAAMALMSIGSMASAANLVDNGSFEDDVITNYYSIVNAGTNGLNKWDVGGTSIDIVSDLGNNSHHWAIDGDQAIDLAGTPGPGSISQDIEAVLGEAYFLTFQYSSNGSGQAAALEVYWGGALIATLDTPAQDTWNTFRAIVMGSVSPTTLTLVTANASNAGPLVDDVSVAAVPEPTSIALLGFSLAGAIGFGWRRRKQAAKA